MIQARVVSCTVSGAGMSALGLGCAKLQGIHLKCFYNFSTKKVSDYYRDEFVHAAKCFLI